MSKKILITGGAGFIGSALTKALLKQGYQCRVLDDFSRGHNRRIESIAKDIETVHGDIRDAQAVNKACEGIDSVFHLAYINGTQFFYSKPDEILDVGVRGMLNILDACKQHHVTDFILASSSEVYQSPPSIPTQEDVPLIVPDPYNPRYSYGGGKIICELMSNHMATKHCKRVVTFRPHNVYGPDMGWEHVIPQFALRLIDLIQKHTEGKLPFKIQGSGEETRSFIYIDDFAKAMLNLYERGEHLNTYHIGTQDEISIAELAHKSAKHFERTIELDHEPLAKGGTLRRCPDTSKMQALGFTPETSIESGLSQTIDWYHQNHHLQPRS